MKHYPQIYFDFAGYSNMAIGLGLMTGFAFPRNFDYPYISQSITEFWRRWHISLSRWFRDYLYIPLGGNRKSLFRTYVNLFTVFFLCGLWHGASWTFVFWGIYHGVFLIIERAGFEAVLMGLWRPLRHSYALLVVMVGWVLFRSDSPDKAFAVLKSMVGWAEGDPVATPLAFYLTHSVSAALVIGCVAATPIAALFRRPLAPLRAPEAPAGRFLMAGGVRVAYSLSSLVLLCLAAVSIASGTYNPFIYFRF